MRRVRRADDAHDGEHGHERTKRVGGEGASKIERQTQSVPKLGRAKQSFHILLDLSSLRRDSN